MPTSTKERRMSMAIPKTNDKYHCDVCIHPERAMIERLLAHGVYVFDVSAEFGISEYFLKKHDVMHSTCIPSIDPESVLRHMRWLNERTYFVTRGVLGETTGGGSVSAKNFNNRILAIKTCLAVITELASLCNVKKNLDPYIVQPRWENTMKKLAHKLRDNPAALKVLASFVEEEGPAETQEQLRRREDRKNGILTEGKGWEDVTDVETKVQILEETNEALKKKIGTILPLKEESPPSEQTAPEN